MRQLVVTILLLFLAITRIGAVPNDEQEGTDDVAPVGSPAPMPLQVLEPTQGAIPFDRVMYVLDVSGSMCEQLPAAITVTDVFCSDGFKAAVVTFADTHSRWKGVKESHPHAKNEACGHNCLEPGWIWMPAHRTELFAYLRGFTGTGGTNPTTALDYAYKHAPAGTLIVFISDGIFTSVDERGLGPIAAVRSAQAWRRSKKLGPVQMLVWATSVNDSKQESLIALAKLGGGGLWRADEHRSGPW